MKMKTCKLCDHPQVRAMEDDFLAGFNDAEIAQRYGVSDRTWRSHRQHSSIINRVRSELEVVEVKPMELPSLQLTSDEIRMLSIWHLCQSVERLSEVARNSGSVRAEQALGDNIMKLNQLTKGLEFERPKQSSAEDHLEPW